MRKREIGFIGWNTDKWIYFFSSLSAVISLINFIRFRLNNIDLDYVAFLIGGWAARTGQIGDLYKINFQKTLQGYVFISENNGLLLYKYLPIFTYIFAPLTYFSYHTSFLVYIFLNIMLVLLSVFITSKAISGSSKILYIIPFASLFTLSSIINGHSSIPLLIFSVIYYLYKKSKWFELGVISLALSYKIQYLIFIPFLFFIVRDVRSYMLGLATSSVMFYSANIWIYGPMLVEDYLPFIINTEITKYGSHGSGMNTLVQILKDIFGNHSLKIYIIVNFIAYFFSLLLISLIRTKKCIIDDNVFFIGSIFLTLFFSVHSWPNDLIILALPMIILYEKTNPVDDLYIAFIIGLYFVKVLMPDMIFSLMIMAMGLLCIVNSFERTVKKPIIT